MEQFLLLASTMTSTPLISPTTSDACECRAHRVQRGVFLRISDGRVIQRCKCRKCHKSHSEATFEPERGQKKRQYNAQIFYLLTSGCSQRRAALDLRLNRKTVVRKFLQLGELATRMLAQMGRSANQRQVIQVQFDDMETFEHSKFKPLSISLAVEDRSRRILGFRVSSMPCKGSIANQSREKYGPRLDERATLREELLRELKPQLAPGATISTDQNPHYTADIAKYLTDHPHRTTKGLRGCVVGQGELKGGGFDPLFALNHTAAMLRANVNRLFRRTWCTTKRKDRLALHIALYAINHNFRLIKSKSEMLTFDPRMLFLQS